MSIPSYQIDIPELIPRNRMNFRTLEKLLQKILPSVVGANPCARSLLFGYIIFSLLFGYLPLATVYIVVPLVPEMLCSLEVDYIAAILLPREDMGHCRVYNSAEMTLEQVIAVLEDAERGGLESVRLHTGDPSVYGAIREQMDALDRLGIPYDDTPGVSSFCGAAASLRAEYTLPGVSQSVIITRVAGRTPVPEAESVAEMARHGASIVLFLSAGMLDKLQAELLKGAYTENTPAAIVYKATWPEEKVVRCTVGTLAESGAREGIRKTALVLVGDFLGAAYERSKLYDPAFTTEFREGTQ